MMIWLWVSLGVIGFIILVYLLVCYSIHHHVFGHRCKLNPDIKYYTKEEFGLETKDFTALFHRCNLKGYYYFYPSNMRNKIIVISHGMWGSHKAYLQEIEFFAKNGWMVLGFDNVGTDLSSGKNIKGLGISVACLNAAIEQVRLDYPNIPVSVFGHSWGGYAAGAIAKYQKNLTSVVSMSGFTSVRRQLATYLPKKLSFLIPGIMLLEWRYCGTCSFLKNEEILQKTKIPTLIVHSKDDPMVPYLSNALMLQKIVSNDCVQYYIVENKKHNPDYSLDALTYTKEAYAKMHQLPKEEQKDFFRKLDFHRMGALDEQVMNEILKFLK